jgi:PAS domain S-box-containing protein
MTDHSADILDFLQESLVVRGLDGRIRDWNAASERLYGWSKDEAMGRSIQDLLRTSGEPFADQESLLTEIGAWEGEVIRTTAAGRKIVVNITWHIRRRAGSTGTDIIETGLAVRRGQASDDEPLAAEQRYRTLFHFIPVALIQFDRTVLAAEFGTLKARGVGDLGRYVEAHPAFVRTAMESIQIREVNRKTVELFGAHDATQLLGPATPFWSESPEIFCQSMQARFRGRIDFEAEMKIRTFDNRILHVLYVTDFPEALRFEALGLACLINIDDRVKAQTMLSQVQSEFAHAARVSMLGELTASIAHEVNQPLGAILTSGEAALRWLDRPEPDIEELRGLSRRTVADARRAANIIRRIRAMAVRTAPAQAPLPLNDMVEEVIVFLRPELRRHDVDVVLNLAAGLPDVTGDRVQLQQVLVNLAMNAMQAMALATITGRRLTVRTGLSEAGMLRIEIEDSGPGIPADHLEQVFDSFFTTKDRGMGIGLAICRSIIEAHGGSIRAGNCSGGTGARFHILLPVQRATEPYTQV